MPSCGVAGGSRPYSLLAGEGMGGAVPALCDVRGGRISFRVLRPARSARPSPCPACKEAARPSGCYYWQGWRCSGASWPQGMEFFSLFYFSLFCKKKSKFTKFFLYQIQKCSSMCKNVHKIHFFVHRVEKMFIQIQNLFIEFKKIHQITLNHKLNLKYHYNINIKLTDKQH